MVSKRAKYILNVVFAVIGAVVGISAGVAFGSVLYNYDAGAFGYASGVFAIVTAAIHIAYAKGRFNHENKGRLKVFMSIGCLVQLAGAVGFVVYLILGCLFQIGKFSVTGRNYFLTCVWCFMTWKWGFFLFLHSRRYLREIMKEGDTEAIITEQE